MLSSPCNVFLSPSFAYCKCHSHLYCHIASVVFWHGNCRSSCKVEFWFVSRGNICDNELFLSCRHVSYSFQKFHALVRKCCHCRRKVYLQVSHLEWAIAMLLHWGKYVFHMLWVSRVVSSSEISGWSCSSLDFIQLPLIDTTLSQNWKKSWPSHSASSIPLNCALHNFSPQETNLSLGTMQCIVSTS